jgi:hypothetical protein
LRCDGTVAWSTITSGEKRYMWSNAQAGVSDTLGQAIHKALDAFARRSPSDAPAAQATSAVSAASGERDANCDCPFLPTGK